MAASATMVCDLELYKTNIFVVELDLFGPVACKFI